MSLKDKINDETIKIPGKVATPEELMKLGTKRHGENERNYQDPKTRTVIIWRKQSDGNYKEILRAFPGYD